MKKLNCILLVDDDEATNYLHQMIIEELGFTEKVVVAQNGLEALDYLKSEEGGIHPQPDLIFLDVNMPRMNGWEFLEAYEKLAANQQGDIVMVMLTTSLNPDDLDKSQRIPKIKGFRNKPLDAKMLQEIMEEFFG